MGKRVSMLLLLRPQTVTGLNQNSLVCGEQYLTSSVMPPVELWEKSPEQ